MLQGLDVKTYAFETPQGSVVPKRENCRLAVKVFVNALTEVGSLDFICDEQPSDAGLTATIIHPADTEPVAVLNVSYGAKGYHAKVVMKNKNVKRDLVVDDSDFALKRLLNHLTNPSSLKPKRKTGSRPIVVDPDIEDVLESGRYGRAEDFYK